MADEIEALPDWSPRGVPTLPNAQGRTVVAERFDRARHGEALWQAIGVPERHDLWQFIPMGPFDEPEPMIEFFGAMHDAGEWHVYVFRAPGSEALLGTASLMAVRPQFGVAEVGCVIYSPELKRTTAATELQYLLATHVFDDLGYRRYEWKCDARNEASRSAAARLGFTYEGIFRKHMISHGLNRDTAWFSITDDEWPAVRDAFEAWLDAAHDDAQGRPERGLAALRGDTR